MPNATRSASPTEAPLRAQPWEKPHLPNLTGTAAADAYRPPGHILGAGKRDRATGDYEPWQPDEGPAWPVVSMMVPSRARLSTSRESVSSTTCGRKN